jgi:uncharacterized protein
VFAQAREDGYTHIACEVNSDPPNPASEAFHAQLGFTEIGTETLSGGKKTVRYLLKTLD